MSKQVIAGLYRELVQEAKRFPQYNFRMYALRKIEDSFQGRLNQDEMAVCSKSNEEFVSAAQKELDRLKRMTVVASLYAHDRLVVEDQNNNIKDSNV